MGGDSLRILRARAHNEMMARDEALMRKLGPSSLAEVTPSRARRVEVGDTIPVYAEYSGTCSESRQVNAMVRLVGGHTVWLEDLDNPSGTFTDSELVDLDTFYAANIRSVHDSYFGAPSDVDGNGQILILMTKEVNLEGSLNGWVWGADLYPSSQCPTSNQAEIFYGLVPDPDGVVSRIVTKQQVLDRYRSLIAHEVTHIIQNAAALFGNAAHKTSWEDEGNATLAEQLVAYGLFGHGSGRDLGYTEYKTGEAWYVDWLGDMAAFFGWSNEGRVQYAPEQCSWVGRRREGNSGPCVGRAVYGVPSMVFRFAMDRWGGEYPGGEQALMKRLIQSPNRGFASLEDVSSWRTEQILASFYISLWTDGRLYNSGGMTSWNLYDIFSKFESSAQLKPYTSRTSQPRFSARIRAGSSLYVHWTPAGSLNLTAIKVTSSGGPVPDHVSVWAFRIR